MDVRIREVVKERRKGDRRGDKREGMEMRMRMWEGGVFGDLDGKGWERKEREEETMGYAEDIRKGSYLISSHLRNA